MGSVPSAFLAVYDIDLIIICNEINISTFTQLSVRMLRFFSAKTGEGDDIIILFIMFHPQPKINITLTVDHLEKF